MSYTDIINNIESLPHYREWECQECGHIQKTYILVIQTNCKNCGQLVKLRGHASIGSEIEDVIDAVLEWLGQSQEFELAIARKQIIDSS